MKMIFDPKKCDRQTDKGATLNLHFRILDNNVVHAHLPLVSVSCGKLGTLSQFEVGGVAKCAQKKCLPTLFPLCLKIYNIDVKCLLKSNVWQSEVPGASSRVQTHNSHGFEKEKCFYQNYLAIRSQHF